MFGFIGWLVEIGFYVIIVGLLWRILRVQTALLRHAQNSKPATPRKRVAKPKERA